MAAEAEVIFRDLTQFEEQEEAALEELLREAEDLNEDENTSESTDQSSSEEEASSSQDDSTVLESAEAENEVENTNGMDEVDEGNPEVIEIVEKDVLQDSLRIENTPEEEVEEEEGNFIVITPEELQLNEEAQELLEKDLTENFLEEDEKLNLEGVEEEVKNVQEVPEITELDQHDEHLELEDMEENVHQEEPEEIPDMSETKQPDDQLELDEIEDSTGDEALNLEETEELQTPTQGDEVDFQDTPEEDLNTDEQNLGESIDEHIDLDSFEEEWSDTGLVSEDQLVKINPDYVVQEHHSASVTEISVPADTETLETKFSQISNDYQSVFTPEEQALAQFKADLLLFELIQARQESYASATTVAEKQELPTPAPFTVSFDEEILPSLSVDHSREEVSSLEEELAQLESPRAFQHFHEQLHESQLQALTIDPQLSVENLADELKLVTQRAPPPDPPPYDFLADLESYQEYEVEARIQELKNPLYPYRPRRKRLQSLDRVRSKIIHAKASTPNTRSEAPKVEIQDTKLKNASYDQETLFDEHSKSQKIPPKVKAKLQVPSTRGVVKDQVEALNKLLSLDYKKIFTDEPIRVITLTATSRKEMGEVFWAKFGDFTQKADVLTYCKRCFVKLSKKYPNWKPMKLFLSIAENRAQKEVYNPELDTTDWVTHNKKKGWEYTGNQRIIIEVKMNSFHLYYAQLEERARTLAADTEQTRIHLSKYDKVSAEYRDKLRFWTHYGYRPRKLTKIYLTKQKEWSVTHVALDGAEILLKALQTGMISNPNLGRIAEAWIKDHQENVGSSRITLQQQGKPLTLNQILPKDLVSDLHNRRIDINSLNENQGAPYVFKFQLEKLKNELLPEVRNVLTEYLGIDPSVLENCRFDVDWGIVKDRSKVLGKDKYSQEFRYTFAPDIVVKDQHGTVIAVIQLKGLTQNKHAITATISVIQMIELVKYHVEHEVPVALVNIKQDEHGLRNEWLIIGKAKTSPSPDLKRLIDSKTGLDPIIPRNARSLKFVEEIHKEIKKNDANIYLIEKQNDFQDLVKRSQMKFQKLQFYNNNPKDLDVSQYWKNITRKYKELKLFEPHKMKFNDFYQQWKSMIVKEYVEKLKKLR